MTRRMRLRWKLKSAGSYPQITQISQIEIKYYLFVLFRVIRGSPLDFR